MPVDDNTIDERMRSAVLTGPSTIELWEQPVGQPRADEVLVRIGSVGVCGSDVHYYRHGRIGDMVVTGPLVLGHEAAGRVVRIGADADAGLFGQRVAIEPQRPCRRCRRCKTGRYNLCPDMRFFATPPVDGAFREYVALPADFAHPVPNSLSDDAAALLEPLSVAIWACRKGDVGPGSRVFITGGGPIGVLTAQVARASGATEIIIADPSAERRERSAVSGATAVLDPTGDFDASDLGVDTFVECSGAAPAVLDGIRSVRGGGTVVLVGLGNEELTLPIQHLQNNEITLTGTFRYADTWPAAIDLVVTGRVDLDSLVTARYPLERAEDALASAGDPSSMKSIVAVHDEHPA